jgi:hypothetical protein
MTVVALISAPMLAVERRARGAVLGAADGNINGIALAVTITEAEIYIGWVDRSGPAFVIQLNQLVKSAVNEIEILLGQRKADL